jgi:hypothetical protein
VSIASRRSLALLPVAALVLAVLPGGAAQALPVSGSRSWLQVSGTGGDPVSLDQTYRSDSTGFDTLWADDDGAWTRATQFGLTVTRPDATWVIGLTAPAGKSLQPGTYSGALPAALRTPDAPGLYVSADGRECDYAPGTFIITRAVFEREGWVRSFHATFHQRCGTDPGSATTGEISIENDPAPAPLTVTLRLDRQAALLPNGHAVLTGRYSCNRPTDLDAFGFVSQPGRRGPVTGFWELRYTACGPTPARMSVEIVPDTEPLHPGEISMNGQTDAYDSVYGFFRDDLLTARVELVPRGEHRS